MVKRTIQIVEPCVGQEEWLALQEPIRNGWLTQGPKVRAFEEAFASKHGVKHGLAVTSCTTGLHLVLVSLGIGPGDEVIVPAFTWIATANVILHCGATPVFVDVEPGTYNINPENIEKKITSKTKAIIAVHLFGLCADIDRIKKKLPSHITIIEDAACAAGGYYKDRAAGSIGDIAVFSLHPRKTITTGEGGIITTNNDELMEHIKILRNHGASISEESRHAGSKPYLLPDFNLLGFNYRMTDLQGAIGLVQLDKLEKLINERTQWAAWYSNQLAGIEWLQIPAEPKQGRHAWQSFVLYVDTKHAPCSRNEMMEKLHENGISTRPGTHAVPTLKYYRERYGYNDEDFPIARKCEENTMAIPLHNKMILEDYEYVVNALKKI